MISTPERKKVKNLFLSENAIMFRMNLFMYLNLTLREWFTNERRCARMDTTF